MPEIHVTPLKATTLSDLQSYLLAQKADL